MSSITVKQGEAKKITFTIKKNGVVQDVTSGIFAFSVRKTTPAYQEMISKADAAFDKTDAATGVVVLPLSTTDLNVNNINAGVYDAELKTTIAADDIDKSSTIKFTVERALTA